MSVLMTMRIRGDGRRLEDITAADTSLMPTIVKSAKEQGLISHRFWATDEEILVVDEWPDQEAFERFFANEGDRIRTLMGKAGVTEQPVITHWRTLATGDQVG
jgi:hypothetical protein